MAKDFNNKHLLVCASKESIKTINNKIVSRSENM
jgi:hypothetical protein